MHLRVLGAATALVLLAACGGSDGPTANPNPPSPRSDASPQAVEATPSADTSSPSTSVSASPRDQRIVVTGYTVFESPTGNILCGIIGEEANYVRCDIGERDWEPPPAPADCEFDYGIGTDLDDDRASLSCVSDAVGEVDLVLEYGERIQGGDILCVSEQTGMTCTHQGNGHGFTLARAEYELF